MIDLAPITRILRAKAGSSVLVTAVHHIKVFELLANEGAMTLRDLSEKLGLKERPAMVLIPSLRSMGLINADNEGRLSLTELGSYLTLSNKNHITGYTSLEAEDPNVLKLTEWLLHDGPARAGGGFSYVRDETAPSPMDEPGLARFFTLALAGRARYLSPVVASKIKTDPGHLLDLAAGSGYYTYEWLLANPRSTATIFDRPEVLRVAEEILNNEYPRHVKERVELKDGDMLTDVIPEADIILAASLFHDWPEDTCEMLMKKFASSLRPGGELWVHDAFLNDTLDGPAAVTDYSVMLFLGTKGRAYSRGEYRNWFDAAGLIPRNEEIPTFLEYGLISAVKPA